MEKECLSTKISQELFKLIADLKSKGFIRVGFNETIKKINKNLAICAIVARDAVPACLVDPMPVLCEQKGVQCVFVDSKTALGRACGMEIDVLACAIYTPKDEDPSKITAEFLKIINK